MGKVILHITKRKQWEQAKLLGVYRGDALDSEGFIHCSTPHQVVRVANALFHGQKGLILLRIDSDEVQAEVRYEGTEGREQYPHIYGCLNVEAVVRVFDFKPKDGKFEVPKEVVDVV
jgi:uncharacterized protein (DUF952 family)